VIDVTMGAAEDKRRAWCETGESADRACADNLASGNPCRRQALSARPHPSRFDRGEESKTKAAVKGFMALAAALLVAGSISVQLAQIRNPSRELIAQLGDKEREQIRSIEVADCRNRVIAGQDSRLAASDSPMGRAELARHFDQVVQYCGCAFEASSHLLTKDNVVRQWTGQGQAFAGALSADASALLDQSARICAEEAGLRTDVAPDAH
jgi:hypothetical protein